MAAFLTPSQAGFRHCILIYDAETRNTAGFLPYVAHLDTADKPTGWLFDAFLLCAGISAPSSRASYNHGPTNREDWEALSEGWFAARRGLNALSEAVGQLQSSLGLPRQPISVILTIPYPSPEQKDFGDVTGDGQSEDLSQHESREVVVRWHIQEVLRQWDAARLPNLKLWGFYWTNEAVSEADEAIVKRTADMVHELGYRLLWIPWFRAPGFERWREFGFDAAILQPNYAFLSDHFGHIRSDRLIEAASLAESLGMGVEMEVGYSPDRDLREREIFRDYLAFGAPNVCGYQSAATAWFQSFQVFVNLRGAPDLDARLVYDQIAHYIRRRPIGLRNDLSQARLTSNGEPVSHAARRLVDGAFVTSQHHLPTTALPPTLTLEWSDSRPVGEVEISVVRGDAVWEGSITVDFRDATGDWHAAGWASVVVPEREPHREKHIIVLPVFREALYGVRIRVDAYNPEISLQVDEIKLTCGPPRLDWIEPNLAYRRPYIVEPEFPRLYGDSGKMLTDGEMSTEGWTQGRSVGWSGRDATIFLDLRRVVRLDRVVVHCDGGGYASVVFPDSVRVAVSAEAPPPAVPTSGFGAPPGRPEVCVTHTVESIFVDGERRVPPDRTAAWGHFSFAFEGVPARFVTVQFQHDGWLMISEIEAWSQGQNVAPEGTYLVTPRPDAKADAPYADDGQRLTDGYIAHGFLPTRIVGWADAGAVTLTVDLGAVRDIRGVTAHTLGGGYAAIVAPSSGELDLSADGINFRCVASSLLSDPGGDTCVHIPLSFKFAAPERARFVRVRLTPSRVWTMLSELSVR